MKIELPMLPEKSKDFLKVPFKMTKRGISIYLKQEEQVCKFLHIKQSKDGSLECIFPNLNSTQRGVAQTLNVGISSQTNHQTKIVDEIAHPERFMNDPYISYHTTGRVNYHGFTFTEQYYDPLDKIERPQFFFMVSLCKIDTLVSVEPSDYEKRDGIVVVDISDYSNKRCNFLFSVVPKNFLDTLSASLPNVFAVDYPLYGLAVEVLDDAATFNLSAVYDESAVVKLKPHCGIYDNQVSTINEAYLNYQHKLYQTKELIVLPPNGEGTIQVIFVVEMRRPPWIQIEFEDKSLVIDKSSIEREQTKLSFKVKNKKTGQTVKNENEIRIKSMFLDANIYEDESIPPEGFI